MATAKKTNYLEPAAVFEELLKCISAGKLSNKMGEMIITISTKYATHPMFGGYKHIREELIHNGILACCKSYAGFRPNRNIIISRDPETNEITESQAVYWDGVIVPYNHNDHYNPFTFFTTCIKNANIQYLKKYYQHKNMINELMIENQMNPDWGYSDMIDAQRRASCDVDEIDEVEKDPLYDYLEEDNDEEPEMGSETDMVDTSIDNINTMEASIMDDEIIIIETEDTGLGIVWTHK